MDPPRQTNRLPSGRFVRDLKLEAERLDMLSGLWPVTWEDVEEIQKLASQIVERTKKELKNRPTKEMADVMS